jgi:Na+-driven multidrug efflux pump
MLRLLFGNIENDVMLADITYFVISGLSYPFLAVYNSCAALFRSMGNSRITMIVSIIMNLINVIGNYIGIFIFDASYLPNAYIIRKAIKDTAVIGLRIEFIK